MSNSVSVKLRIFIGTSLFFVLLFAGFYLYSDSFEDTETNLKKDEVESNETDDKIVRFISVTANFSLPKKLVFAGEVVPLTDEYVREQLDNEVISNAYRHSRTIQILKHSARWKDEISRILHEEGVPEDFFYLAIAESELSNTARSHVGAMGMWQFMPRTGKEFGLIENAYIDQRRDPVLATRAACKYLNRAYNQLGSWVLAAASYNMGLAGVKNKVKDQKVNSYFDLHLNQETARYVYRILAFKLIVENPKAYGFEIKDEDLYQPWVYNEKVVTEDIPNLVNFAIENGTNYKDLRRMNPWFNNSSSYRLDVPKKDSLIIRIPVNQSLDSTISLR